MARFCGRIGWTVTVAATPDEGLALARCGGFDAVALDHYMPGRDGLDVLPELLACPDAPPVIFVTAAEEPRIAVTALKAGAADYVVKDVAGHFLELLVAAVRQAVAQRALHRAKEAAEQAAREGMARLELLTEQQAVLLREMNHRIANSLQLITALLGMHARRSDDETIKEALRQAGERVEAVAKIHRRLYTSADIGHVDMDDYLRGLLAEMERVSSGSVAHIVLTCDPVRLPTDKAISVGLIVSELVTNAVNTPTAPARTGRCGSSCAAAAPITGERAIGAGARGAGAGCSPSRMTGLASRRTPSRAAPGSARSSSTRWPAPSMPACATISGARGPGSRSIFRPKRGRSEGGRSEGGRSEGGPLAGIAQPPGPRCRACAGRAAAAGRRRTTPPPRSRPARRAR